LSLTAALPLFEKNELSRNSFNSWAKFLMRFTHKRPGVIALRQPRVNPPLLPAASAHLDLPIGAA
jgi:hypothetical protein